MYMFSVHIFFKASGATEAAANSGPPHPADLPPDVAGPQPTPLPAQVGHNISIIHIFTYICMNFINIFVY